MRLCVQLAAKTLGVAAVSYLLLSKRDRKRAHVLFAANTSDASNFIPQYYTDQFSDEPSTRLRKRSVALIGLTGAGKTSIFNLMTGLHNELGNKIVSQTEQCSTATTTDGKFVVIDTVGLKDSRDEREGRYKVIDFLLSFKDGMDVIFFVVQHSVFGTDDRDLFEEIYHKLLTQDAYRNSCLVITNYDKLDSNHDCLYDKNSKKQQMLIDQLRKNKHYAYVLEKFENRVFCVDIPPKCLTGEEKWDTDMEERNERKRKASKGIIESFLDDFHPPHFDCENLQQLSRIQKDNDRLQEENGKLKKDNEALKNQLNYQTDSCHKAVVEVSDLQDYVESAMHRSRVYDLISMIPLLNWYTSYVDIESREEVLDKIKKSRKRMSFTK